MAFQSICETITALHIKHFRQLTIIPDNIDVIGDQKNLANCIKSIAKRLGLCYTIAQVGI